MSENNGRKGGLDKRIVLFFVFAVACVAAFLIVILVKTCDADHEDKVIEQELQEQSMNVVEMAPLHQLA